MLNESGFYYVASQFRHYGAYAPEEISREVLAISFDANGVVSNIERFGLKDGRVITLSRRVTDDQAHDSTFVRQLLSSFGRVNAGDFLGELRVAVPANLANAKLTCRFADRQADFTACQSLRRLSFLVTMGLMPISLIRFRSI